MLKDKFKFKSRNGTTIYTAVKIAGDQYLVSWEEFGIGEGGSRPYQDEAIKAYIEDGTWILVEEPEVPQLISSGTGGWVLQKDGNLSISGIGLGVARPILETRKIGKNRIELVDNGFPNALWEIARLMTKAQEVKGYKDHDWKNLPIETFSAAASRHRMKTNMGEIYDDEFEGFEILHKVNEAFNVLAELELLLTKNGH